MVFGNGFTGLLVACVVALSSGIALLICFREIVREISARTVPRFDRLLRQNRKQVLDDGAEFVVEDQVFNEILANQALRQRSAVREWQEPGTYLLALSFLALIAAAGFVTGLAHLT